MAFIFPGALVLQNFPNGIPWALDNICMLTTHKLICLALRCSLNPL